MCRSFKGSSFIELFVLVDYIHEIIIIINIIIINIRKNLWYNTEPALSGGLAVLKLHLPEPIQYQ